MSSLLNARSQARFIERLTWGLLLLVTIPLTSWWVSIAIGIVLAIRFSPYYELIVLGMLLDLLYSNPTPVLFNMPLLFSVTLSLAFIGITLVIKQTRLAV